MTEDNRIDQIREVVDEYESIRSRFQVDTTTSYGPRFLNRIRAILDSAPPAPQVWFPGDTVPAGTPVVNHVGGVWNHHNDRQIKTGYAVEIHLPDLVELDAIASAARANTESGEA